MEVAAILAGHAPTRLSDIAAGETRTLNGLALSPTMAAMCAEDYVRTVRFLRGVHAAIREARRLTPDRAVRVLYAGCGPLATLALPLMSVLGPETVGFTLLDIHPASVARVRDAVKRLGVEASVEAFVTADAASYAVGAPPDVIVLEIMQAALAAEPQVGVTRHLLAQAPDALLVPETVCLSLVWADPTAMMSNAGFAEAQRTASPVFTLDRATIRAWDPAWRDVLPASVLTVPGDVGPTRMPFLLTTIQTFGPHWIRGRESGLTFPRHLDLDGARPSSRLRFSYRLGSTPGLQHTILPPPEEGTTGARPRASA